MPLHSKFSTTASLAPKGIIKGGDRGDGLADWDGYSGGDNRRIRSFRADHILNISSQTSPAGLSSVAVVAHSVTAGHHAIPIEFSTTASVFIALRRDRSLAPKGIIKGGDWGDGLDDRDGYSGAHEDL